MILQIKLLSILTILRKKLKYNANFIHSIHEDFSHLVDNFPLFISEMATKSIIMSVCLLETVRAYQNQDSDPYPYYDPPVSENAISYSYKTALKRQATFGGGAALDPGALIGVLALVSFLHKNTIIFSEFYFVIKFSNVILVGLSCSGGSGHPCCSQCSDRG